MSILQAIEVFNAQVHALVFDVAHDYASLEQDVIYKEMEKESRRLYTLFHSSTLTRAEQKSIFLAYCKERSHQNIGTSLSFSAYPSGYTNALYWSIATKLFKPRLLADMLAILSPQTTTYISAEFESTTLSSDVNYEARRQWFKEVAIEIKVRDINELAIELPEDLSAYVFWGPYCLCISDLCHYDIDRHIEFYDKLVAFSPAFADHLYAFNASLSQLKEDIHYIKNKGQSPLLAIKSLMANLVKNGERMTGKEYAGRGAEIACGVFNHYQQTLPCNVHQAMMNLKTWGGKTLNAIMDDLADGSCVETAASELAEILENTLNQQLLSTQTPQSAHLVEEIKRKYRGKHRRQFNLIEQVHLSLPETLIKTSLSEVCVYKPEELIDLIIGFPPFLYEALLGEVVIDYDEEALNGLVHALYYGFFNAEQVKALVPAILTHLPRLAERENALSIALFSNHAPLVEGVLNDYNEKERVIALNKPDSDGDTLLHRAAESPESLRVLLMSYSLKHLGKVLFKTNKDGYCVIDLCAENPLSLKLLLNHFPIDERPCILKKVAGGMHPLIYAISKNPENLAFVLHLYPKQKHQYLLKKAVNERGDTVLHLVAEYPHLMQMVLNYYPQEERLAAVMAKNRLGGNVLQAIHENIESLELILSLYPPSARWAVVKEENHLKISPLLHWIVPNKNYLQRLFNLLPYHPLDLVKEKIDNRHTLLYWAAAYRESFDFILNTYPREEQFQAAQERGADGNGLLYWVAHDEESLKKVLALYPKDQRLFAIKKSSICSTLLAGALYNPDSLALILSFYPENERFDALMDERPFSGKPLLHAAFDEPASLKMMLLNLPMADRFKAITFTCGSIKQSLFNLTYTNKAFKTLRMMLSLLPEEQQVQVMVGEADNLLLHSCVEAFDYLQWMVDIYPVKKRLTWLQKKDHLQQTVFHAALPYQKSFEFLLSLYPKEQRLSILREKDSKGVTVISELKKYPDRAPSILRSLPVEQRLPLLQQMVVGLPLIYHLAINIDTLSELLALLPDEETKLKALYELSSDTNSIWLKMILYPQQIDNDLYNTLYNLFNDIQDVTLLSRRRRWVSRFFSDTMDAQEYAFIHLLFSFTSHQEIFQHVFNFLSSSSVRGYKLELLNKLTRDAQGDDVLSFDDKCNWLKRTWQEAGWLEVREESEEEEWLTASI